MTKKTTRYRVKQVAELTGVSVRALHHWDSIGLLEPSVRTDAGYRLYEAADLLRLQHILVGRALGLSLEEIRGLLDDPSTDRRELLSRQRESLLAERERTDKMIQSIDAALAHLDRGGDLQPADLFDGFDPADYEDEARERWGATEAYAESARRTKKYTDDDWKRMKAEANELMLRLARAMERGDDPASDGVVAMAEEHRAHIDRWFYPCSREAHRGLAALYESDERFAASFDKIRDGLATYLVSAIRAVPPEAT